VCILGNRFIIDPARCITKPNGGEEGDLDLIDTTRESTQESKAKVDEFVLTRGWRIEEQRVDRGLRRLGWVPVSQSDRRSTPPVSERGVSCPSPFIAERPGKDAPGYR
jgi:hypothetical protein